MDRPPRWLLAGGTVMLMLLLAQVALLAFSLGEIGSTQDHVARTDTRLAQVLEIAKPVAEEGEPILRDAGPLIDEGTSLIRDLGAFARPVSDDGSDLSVTLDRLPRLGADLQKLISAAVPAVVRGSALLEEVESSDAIQSGVRVPLILSELLETQRMTLETQRATLQTQQRTLAAQLTLLDRFGRSLDIQRGTLKHARSIDRKTGGEFSGPGGG